MGRGARRRPRLLALKLREVRRRLSLSQGALIKHMGVQNHINQGEISDFEHGVREPDLLTLKAYADAVGVSIDCLVDDDAKLPDKLPGAKYTKVNGRKPRNRPARTTTVTLWLDIVSDSHIIREEDLARNAIEKRYLKQLGMKKVGDREYELIMSYEGEDDLDERIYALLSMIMREARGRKCNINVNVRERATDRYW
ncbi:MAG: helix-turn-helix transcriptional regulator [Chloracidobacterium sp.]|nr:helix-turn-helix transcriptional regulator [Chloracidobacterium sp.]